jgi:hypothetical protein
LWGRTHDADAFGNEYRVERCGEPGVSVTEQQLGRLDPVGDQVAGDLGGPGAGWVCGDPGEVGAAGAVLDHDQGVEAAQGDGVDVQEVDSEDAVGLAGQELAPGGA